MIKEAINRIMELSVPKVETINGQTYSLCDGKAQVLKKPQPSTLKVNTLSAIVDYLRDEDFDGGDVDDSDLAIHIVSHKEVELITKLDDADKNRTVLMRATTDLYEDNFNFGRKMDKENFIIELMSKFVPTKDRDHLLKIAGTMKSEKVKESADDGVTQTVATKEGAALVSKEKVKNPVALAPFRTFREVEQPTSQFVFRLHQKYDGDLPQVALYEADGGSWKLQAMQNIVDYFEKAELEILIL